MFDELRMRIKTLLDEIEYTHVKRNWVERLIAAGIEERDAHQWAAEVGHIVDEYERSLRFLVDLLEKTSDPAAAAEALEGWVAYTRDLTIWKLDEVTNELKKLYPKYLPPPKPDDEDDESPT